MSGLHIAEPGWWKRAGTHAWKFLTAAFAGLIGTLRQVLGYSESRLGVVRMFMSLTIILALAYFGYQEVYADNAAFGANRFKDYFTAFIWGFGASATKEAVLGAFRGFEGMGILKPPPEN